jgi:REP element-mobilizing transposase RayT
LSEIVRAFKSFSARRINAERGTTGIPVWQRNYYEHIIRHDREWAAIRQYIDLNPARWALDHDHPANRPRPPLDISDPYWREAEL